MKLHPSEVTIPDSQYLCQNFRHHFNWAIDPAVNNEDHDARSGTWTEFTDSSGNESLTADTLPMFLDLSLRALDCASDRESIDWDNEATLVPPSYTQTTQTTFAHTLLT